MADIAPAIPCTIAGAMALAMASTASIGVSGSTRPSSTARGGTSSLRGTMCNSVTVCPPCAALFLALFSIPHVLAAIASFFKIIIFRVEIFRRRIFRVFGVHVVIQYISVGSKEILLILPLLHDIDEGVKLLLDILCNATKRRGIS